MKSAVYDFKAIARSSAQSTSFKVMEGPMCADFGEERMALSVPFDADRPPEWPAIMQYNPMTDEAAWIECRDPFTIQIAGRKNDAAREIALQRPNPTPLRIDWGAMLWQYLSDLGIRCIRTEPCELGARVGMQIMVGDTYYSADQQLHVDWPHEVSDAAPHLSALAKAIADKLGARPELHSCQLLCPMFDGVEAIALEHNNLRARAVRSVVQFDGYVPIALTRVDVLFPVLP